MNKITFGIFSDLHATAIPDSSTRLDNFVKTAKDRKLDFIVQLGDFCSEERKRDALLSNLSTLNLPLYHVIGNHDCETSTIDELKNIYSLPNTYYSFKIKDVKFIVLDANYVKTTEGIRHYDHTKYKRGSDIHPIIPSDQIEWLRNELLDDSKYYLIFSHHSLENPFSNRGVSNKEEIRSILEDVNKDEKRVLMCINGHDHADSIELINDIYYFGLNSMTYIWVGPENEHFSFSEDIHRDFPYIKDLIVYGASGLFSFITIYEDGNIEVEGMESDYLNMSPQELGIESWNNRSVLPKISPLNTKEKAVNN